MDNAVTNLCKMILCIHRVFPVGGLVSTRVGEYEPTPCQQQLLFVILILAVHVAVKWHFRVDLYFVLTK